MSQNNENGGYSYSPVNPSYTFNGNNTNYLFVRSGRYDINLTTSSTPRGNPNSKNTFEARTDTTTNVYFQPSAMPTVPSSPARATVGAQSGFPGFGYVAASPSQNEFRQSQGSSSPCLPESPVHFPSAPANGTPARDGFSTPQPAPRGNPSGQYVHNSTPRPVTK